VARLASFVNMLKPLTSIVCAVHQTELLWQYTFVRDVAGNSSRLLQLLVLLVRHDPSPSQRLPVPGLQVLSRHPGSCTSRTYRAT
jgi:hypothetical protein